MFGCALTKDSDDKAVRIDNAKVTQKGEMSIISNDHMTVSTPSLSLVSDQAVSNPSGWCCTGCNMSTGNCDECHTCDVLVID
jgi:hypothetical protein